MRQALYHAIDIDAIKSKHDARLGAARPARMTPSLNASTTRSSRSACRSTSAASKKLLAEAGYPNGFEVTLDCPNNRYVNDEEICMAVAAMLAKIGVKTKVNTQPRATYFPKLEKYDTSMYMLGWGGAITDAQTTLSPVLRTKDDKRQWLLQLRALRQPEARRADRQRGSRARSGQAARNDPAGARRAQRTGASRSAAPADDSVGDAQQRDGRAPAG